MYVPLIKSQLERRKPTERVICSSGTRSNATPVALPTLPLKRHGLGYSPLPPMAHPLCQPHLTFSTLLLEVGNRVLRRVPVHALSHIPVLHDASPHEPENACNIAFTV